MKLKINLEGKLYEVDVEAFEPDPVVNYPAGYVPPMTTTLRVPAGPAIVPQAAAPPSPSGPVDEAKVCRSPIAGIVTQVPSSVGQEIKEGESLMVLEAMKMETNITAPVSGKIAKIHVKAGDSVQGGQVLVEFE